MRGHWISSTRKLNNHYQSSGGLPVGDWWDLTYNLTHAGLTFGLDAIDNIRFENPPYRLLPKWLRRAKKVRVRICMDESGIGSGNNVYLSSIGLYARLYDTQGNIVVYRINYDAPGWSPHPSTWLPLDEQPFTDIWGNTRYGERFVFDSSLGFYVPKTTDFIIEPDLLLPGNNGIYDIYIGYMYVGSEVLPTTAQITRKARLEKL